MSDPVDSGPTSSQNNDWMEPSRSNITLIYILYLASFMLGISWFVGIIFAYVNSKKADGWLESHYRWAIRTFWIGVLFCTISSVLTVIFIGILGFIATAVWMVVRVIIGLQKANRSEPINNPKSWLF